MKRWFCALIGTVLLFSAACQLRFTPPTPLDPTLVPQAAVEPLAEDVSSESEFERLLPDGPATSTSKDNAPLSREEPSPMDTFINNFSDTDPDFSVESYQDFAFLLGASTLDGKQSQSLSPFSLYFALAMLAEGANGDTQAELLRLLGTSDVKTLQQQAASLMENNLMEGETSVVDTHNSFWMTNSLPVRFRDSYVSGLQERYRAEAFTEDLSAAEAQQHIADWIKHYTRDTIDPSFHLDPFTVSVLVNTLYLSDGWSDPFDPIDTEQGDFHCADGAVVEADFMQNGFGNTSVVQGDGFLRCSLPLARIGSVVLVLPDEDVPLSRLVRDAESLKRTMNSGIEQRCILHVRMPKFRLHTRYEMQSLLQALGAPTAFSNEADFSNMLETGSVYVDQVIHETYVSMEEKGTEASAYTMITTRATGALILPVELPRVEMNFDRPFLFAITGLDGSILFLGTVTEIPQS